MANNYYNKNATEFYENTVNVDMSALMDKFVQLLPAGGSVLDLGCGSGRDSLSFKKLGFDVVMLDPSEKMCEMAHSLAKCEYVCTTAEEMDFVDKFDGIWACASLLHVSEKNTPIAYKKIEEALKKNGILFASYKYGKGEKDRGERHFLDMYENGLSKIIAKTENLEIIEMWVTADVRVDREDEKWLNAIIKKR